MHTKKNYTDKINELTTTRKITLDVVFFIFSLPKVVGSHRIAFLIIIWQLVIGWLTTQEFIF